MKKINTLVWRIIQLVILPLAVYAGIFFNGESFGQTHTMLTNFVVKYPSMIYMSMDLYALCKAITLIPAAIGYLMPAGFTANAYLFGLMIDKDLVFLMLVLFFFTTRAPKLPNLARRRAAEYA
ncbi:hypothetical protein P5704_026135 (plasmid) [Pseudomonas sp. FeN3W]|nr:hypothetical protein P5704_026135 [Pseudomonas sp. FeN3W]